jgi:hypothetical protein
VATSRSPLLLVGYLEAYLGRLERWLWDWRIDLNVSESTSVLFVKATGRIQNPRAVKFLGEPMQWEEAAKYFRVTLDTQLTSSAHVNQVGKKAAQRFGVLSPSLTGEAPLCQKRCAALQAAHPSYD